jgi:hypothetical protein
MSDIFLKHVGNREEKGEVRQLLDFVMASQGGRTTNTMIIAIWDRWKGQ